MWAGKREPQLDCDEKWMVRGMVSVMGCQLVRHHWAGLMAETWVVSTDKREADEMGVQKVAMMVCATFGPLVCASASFLVVLWAALTASWSVGVMANIMASLWDAESVIYSVEKMVYAMADATDEPKGNI